MPAFLPSVEHLQHALKRALVFCVSFLMPACCITQVQTRLAFYVDQAEALKFTDRTIGQQWLDSTIHFKPLPTDYLVKWAALKVDYAQIEGHLPAYFKELIRTDSILNLPEVKASLQDNRPNYDQQLAWADYYKRLGNYAQAGQLFRQLLSQLQAEPRQSTELYQIQFNVNQQLAFTYLSEGNALMAITHYRQSLDNYRLYGKSSIGYVNALYKIGDIYLQQQDLEQAGKHYQMAIDSLEKAIQLSNPGKWSDYAFNAYRRMGYWHTQMNQDSLAFAYFDKALRLEKVNQSFQSNLLDMMGETYNGMKKFKQAEQLYHKSLQLKETRYGFEGDQVATTWFLMGNNQADQGHFQKACQAYQQALHCLSPDIDSSAFLGQFLGKRQAPKMLLSKILSGKAQALKSWYKQEHETQLLKTAWQHALLAVQLLDSLRFRYSDETDKQNLLSNSLLIFDHTLELGFLLDSLDFCTENPGGYYRMELFKLVEKCQSLLLYESQKESAALQVSVIPDSLIQLERRLRLEISRREKQNFGQLQPALNLLSPQDSLIALQSEYAQLIAFFEQQFPDYYRLKYDLQACNAAMVQSDLPDSSSALLEYFIGTDKIFIFCIGKSSFEFQTVPKNFPLEQLVSQFRYGLNAYHTGRNGNYDSLSTLYSEAAHLLYLKLIAPVEKFLPEKVVIVADGVLGLIPFEALLVEKPLDKISRWQLHHYWLNDHAPMYAYSAMMFHEMRHKKHLNEPALPFLGFAPHFEGDTLTLAQPLSASSETRSKLAPLPFSGEEVYQTQHLMGGAAYYGPDASRERFLQMASKARCLHLATHGQANQSSGNQSYLLFSIPDNNLDSAIVYALDVYNMALSCDLVTLSACETGIGELRQAAGIYSLGRAFAYAGAKSVVTSLWQVNDVRTKDLMLEFYRLLHAGLPKDQAICQAKRHYLATMRGLNAHPYYWAGFIGFGDPTPLR